MQTKTKILLVLICNQDKKKNHSHIPSPTYGSISWNPLPYVELQWHERHITIMHLGSAVADEQRFCTCCRGA